MKNLKILSLFLILAAFTSCDKEEAPMAAFEAASSAVVVGEDVEFTITGSGDFHSFWPGDGTSGINIEEMEFTYAYLTPGTYTARLIASNLQDDYSVQRDSAVIQITVTDNEDHVHTRFSTYKLDFRYNFEGFEDKKLKYKLDGNINGTDISFEVPNSSILDEMKSVFSVPATSMVYVGTEEQKSAITKNDFNSPVEYRIVASDGSEEISTVTVARLPKSSNAQLMSFGLSGMPGGIGYTTIQEGNDVDVILSDSTGLTELKSVFAIHDFARAYIGGVEQTSEKTVADYSSQVTFNIQAEDGTASDYYINTLFQPVLVRFYFGDGNPFAAEGTFNATMDTIFVQTPAGSDLSALKPSFVTRPNDAILTLGGVVQQSGVTVTDFSSPLACIVSGDVDTKFVVAVN